MPAPRATPAPDFTRLKAGDSFLLSGTVFTARDRAHRWLLAHDFKPLQGGIVFHCGPIVEKNVVIAAGPTTSGRVNRYTPDLIKRYGVRAIIGKGGMDAATLDAMRGRCVYFAAVGGAAILYAKRMKVKSVTCLDFGMAEAVWELEVEGLPLIVAMDSHGRSIYDEVAQRSHAELKKML